MGFGGVLTIIFVIAKILGYIDWSWWVVFLPYLLQLTIIVTSGTLNDNKNNRIR